MVSVDRSVSVRDCDTQKEEKQSIGFLFQVMKREIAVKRVQSAR